jgi:ABC-type multidrug transport system fused ATPase/permease subunit
VNSSSNISLIPLFKLKNNFSDNRITKTFNKKDKSLNNNFKIKWKRILSYYNHVWLFTLFGIIGSIMSGCIESFRGVVIAKIINVFSNQGNDLKKDSKRLSHYIWPMIFLLFISLLIMNVNFILSGVHLNFILIKERFSTVIKQGVDFFNINHMNDDSIRYDDIDIKKSNSKNEKSEDNNTNIKKTIKNYLESKNNNYNTVYNKKDDKYCFAPLMTLFSVINCNVGYMISFISAVVCSFIIAFMYSKLLTKELLIFAPVIIISCYLKVKAFNITDEERNIIFYNIVLFK